MLATTIHKSNTTPHHQNSGRQHTNLPYQEIAPPPVPPTTGRRGDGLVVSKPNSVSGDSIIAINPVAAQRFLFTKPAPLQRLGSSRLTPPQRECFSWCSLERR